MIVTVHDSGPGIPSKTLDKIFLPFYTTKAVGNGTGLGLSINRNIMNDHNGDLTVANHPDGGAIFRPIHSLKGNAAYFGMSKVGAWEPITHE